MPRQKLAIISTHPIQYYAPVFRALAGSALVEPRVFYTWSQTAEGAVRDPDFATEIAWDVPLLDGYEHEFVPNVATRPGSDHFWGIRNPTLTRAVKGWGAEAVLVFGWNLSAHLQALRDFKGRIPVFFRGDSTLLDEQSPLRAQARRLFLSWIYRQIDVAIAVGQNNRDYFLRHGVPENRIAFAPHSIDVRRFAADADEHERNARAWRRRLDIDDDALVLLYAGKLIPKKDPLLLLDAFRKLRSPAHLVLCGNGVLEGALRARAGGHPRIHFLPFQNQRAMPALYRLGDVFVLPSRGPGETWGLALNEALACARAVVAGSKVGAARDLIQHGLNGWVFESGSLDGLARVLEQIGATDRSRLRAMGEEGQRLSSAWSSEETAARIAEVVSGFVRPRRKLLVLLPQAFANGGIQRFNRTLLAACGQLAVDCDVHSLADAPEAVGRWRMAANVAVRVYGGSRTRYALNVALAILRGRHDIVIVGHVHLLLLAAAALKLRPGKRPPLLLIGHGVELWTSVRGARRRALRAVNRILVVSNYTGEIVRAQAPELPADRFCVFPNALDEAWLQHHAAMAPAGRARMPDRFILSVARLTRHDRTKGIVAVIEALAMVDDTSIHHVIAGAGDDVEFLRLTAQRCNVADRVHFAGKVSDAELVDLYRHCIAFVLPSGQEGFGIVFIEAMYFGAPVIAARAKGAVDVVRDGETGLLVGYGDVIAIKQAIERLLADPGLRERLRVAGRALVTGDGAFTFRAFVRRFAALLDVAAP